jgi:His/Glu/Gln/Arg/opine family amino acid ABC transporter permease subunit
MDLELAWQSFPKLLSGAGLTLVLVSLAALLGLAFAIPVALARLSRSPLLWVPAYLYILFFRGTPLLVQIFMVYYGLAQLALIRASVLWPLFREAYFCAVLALMLCTSGYTAEILRGAMLGVPVGEIEAARICGMSPMQTLRRIVLPRAFQLALPAYTNELILLVKGSALVSTITLIDLTGAAMAIYYRTYDPFTPLVLAGALYLVINNGLARLSQALEQRLAGVQPAGHGSARGLRRAAAPL